MSTDRNPARPTHDPRAAQLGLLLLAVACAVLCVARPAAAQQKTLSGRWSASAMHTAWNIGDWGPACGPRPGGGGAPGGMVTIVQQGGELSMSGAGRSYSTTQCWDQSGGGAVSHTGGKRGWRTVCRTAGGDPRQATVITNVTASDTYITFDETGQYQFVIQGQNCTASVRRSRSFRLIQREGEPPPGAAAPPSTTATATATSTATTPTEPESGARPQPTPTPQPRPTAIAKTCDSPGPPARLEVRPARKLLRPGEQFAFRASVLDAGGCLLAAMAPKWTLTDPGAPAKLTGPGRVEVAADAPETEVELTATVGGHSVQVVVEIASREKYDALLSQGGFNEDGESTEAAVAVIASGSVGARSAVSRDGARSRRLLFATVVGALALLCGGLGVVVIRRARRRRREAARRMAMARELARPVPNPGRADGMVCPTCRREYPPEETYCADDGNRLVPLAPRSAPRGPTGGICPVCQQGFDPGIRSCPEHGEELIPAALYRAQPTPAPIPTKKICPVCGTQYEGDAQFCGTDGATLVPIN